MSTAINPGLAALTTGTWTVAASHSTVIPAWRGSPRCTYSLSVKSGGSRPK